MENQFENKIKKIVDRVVVNAGIGKLVTTTPSFEEKILPQIMKDIGQITGQYPKICRAKKSIAGFKVRENQIVGVMVTLRGKKMVDFLSRLIKIVLPRVRDFSGIPDKNIDDGGSLNLGFRDQYVFPEINPEESTSAFSLGVNIVSKIKNKRLAKEEYLKVGFPLKIKK